MRSLLFNTFLAGLLLWLLMPEPSF